MDHIDRQISELRMMFDSKRIIDETTRATLSKDEVAEIKRIIKNNTSDGRHEVYDTLIVELKDGYCYIKDSYEV